MVPRASRKKPAQSRSRHTVHVILEAAARVFDQHGMKATTNQIAEVAGVSVGSLYQYFPDKQALITELHERHRALVAEQLACAMDEAATRAMVEVVRRAVAGCVSVHRERPGLQRLLHLHGPQLSYPDKSSPAKVAVRRQVCQWLEAQLPAADPAAVMRATQTLLTLVESLVHDAVLDSSEPHDDAVEAENITRVVCGYLSQLAIGE
ncbi:TetR/AcrR family transcriptional regulator [Ideonella sp. DXS29W]|uniref:TetR/AcrR family transcriptional regulator n=1 Tax=Ideonella lacteola TaxID=2984193 RepID=A0ABU9BIR3_9BURK